MAFELHLVESRGQLRDTIATFNQEAKEHPDRTRKILSQTTYWIWDAGLKAFGPSKFVGFQGMNFKEYEAAKRNFSLGAKLNEILPHLGIEFITGPLKTKARQKGLLKRGAEA